MMSKMQKNLVTTGKDGKVQAEDKVIKYLDGLVTWHNWDWLEPKL